MFNIKILLKRAHKEKKRQTRTTLKATSGKMSAPTENNFSIPENNSSQTNQVNDDDIPPPPRPCICSLQRQPACGGHQWTCPYCQTVYGGSN